MQQCVLCRYDSVLCKQVDCNLRMHWKLKVFEELFIDRVAFLLCVNNVLYQSLSPLFVLCVLVLCSDKIKLKHSKNSLHLRNISRVDGLPEHLEKFFSRVSHQKLSS